MGRLTDENAEPLVCELMDCELKECEPETGCALPTAPLYVPSTFDVRSSALDHAINSIQHTNIDYMFSNREIIERAKAFEEYLNEVIER